MVHISYGNLLRVAPDLKALMEEFFHTVFMFSMTLSEADAGAIVGRMRAALSDDVEFLDRLRRHLPLYALRWSLILLNPFRRDRVSSLPDKSDARMALRAERLAKARRVLAGISKYRSRLGSLANG